MYQEIQNPKTIATQLMNLGNQVALSPTAFSSEEDAQLVRTILENNGYTIVHYDSRDCGPHIVLLLVAKKEYIK